MDDGVFPITCANNRRSTAPCPDAWSCFSGAIAHCVLMRERLRCLYRPSSTLNTVLTMTHAINLLPAKQHNATPSHTYSPNKSLAFSKYALPLSRSPHSSVPSSITPAILSTAAAGVKG